MSERPRPLEGQDMETLTDEVQYLRRCIRDLVAFSALPAVWTGREPRAIVESLAEVLLHTLRLDLVYVRVQGAPHEAMLEAARAERQPDVANQAAAIGTALAPWLTTGGSYSSSSLPNPAGDGTVRLAVTPVGYEGKYGVVAAGSQRSDFPTELDRLLLNVGANQVAIWLQEARLRAALQESEARFRALTNAVPAMIWAAAPDGAMTLVTDQWLQYCGMTAEQLARDWPQLVLHPEDYERYMAQWTQALAQGAPYEIEVRNRRAADGQYRWFLTRAVPARSAGGRIIGWYGTSTDIHNRKQMEEVGLRLAAVVESSYDAIISKSLDGVVTSWNTAAERIFGYRAQEMIGQPILRLLPEDRQDEERLILERLRQGERVDHFETVRWTKDGRLLDVSVTISPLRNERGIIIGAAKIARDISAHKQAEETQAQLLAAVQRANEELQQFAYIVSHDLNEPLRTMSSFVNLLARRYQGKLDAEADEYIAFVTDAAQRMQQMITDLLAYTRAGGQDLTFAPVDCEALLARVLTDLHIAIAESGATITHDPLPPVQGDATRLGQVLQNLIGNALKFRGQAPPCIHVSADKEGQHWRFAVHDNGIGIDPQQAKRLFQVFQRLHTRAEYQGTGIGLAICKKIVERHGGRIWVESQPGKGSIFYFTIGEKSSQHGRER